LQSKNIGIVIAVCKNIKPGIPKIPQDKINLIKNFGVHNDYHAGKYIRHRYLARKNPNRLNNRQILLVDQYIHTDIAAHGIKVKVGQLGENILLSGIGLMKMQIGTILQINQCRIQLTEIRHPCDQLNAIDPNLMDVVMSDKKNPASYNAGILGIVLEGGPIAAGDDVAVLS